MCESVCVFERERERERERVLLNAKVSFKEFFQSYSILKSQEKGVDLFPIFVFKK